MKLEIGKLRRAQFLISNFQFLLLVLAFAAPSAWAACGTAPTKLFLSTVAGTISGTHTLVTASGTETNDASPKTAKTTSTWYQMKAGVSANTTSSTDNTSGDSMGWINDAASVNAGCSVPSGTWTFSDSMNDSSGAQTNAQLSIHIYKANAGVFTAQQCGFTNSTVSMGTTAATITASTTCARIDFATSDKLYVEVYYKTGTTNSSSSNTGQTHLNALGVNDFVSFPQDITTPGPSCGGSSAIALMGVGCK
ncbi:MAG: hypothetical protein ACYDA9_05245 [Terriglobia bacterium]